MKGQNNETVFQRQKKIRPQIEQILPEHLKQDTCENALKFAAYLREHKMTPQWGSANSWKFSYKNKGVGYIKLKSGSWYICPIGTPNDYERPAAAENLTKFILENLKPCESCLPCRPGRKIVFAGKELDNMCGHFTIQICDPNDIDIDKAKKLITIRVNAIENNEVPKVNYTGKKHRKQESDPGV